MQPQGQAASSTLPALLELSTSAHTGIESLSNRLAELASDGVKFDGKEIGALVVHLDGALALARSCRDMIPKLTVAVAGAAGGSGGAEQEETISIEGLQELAARFHTIEDEVFPAGAVSDTLTGLPGRDLGIKAIQSARSMSRPRYGAVFTIDRLRYMSSRYGTSAGQMAIRQYCQFLGQKLPNDTMMFRWGGGSLLALFDLSGMLSDARTIAEHIGGQKVKLNFESQQRSVLLNLTATTCTVALQAAPTDLQVVTDFDSFVWGHSRKQPD